MHTDQGPPGDREGACHGTVRTMVNSPLSACLLFHEAGRRRWKVVPIRPLFAIVSTYQAPLYTYLLTYLLALVLVLENDVACLCRIRYGQNIMPISGHQTMISRYIEKIDFATNDIRRDTICRYRDDISPHRSLTSVSQQERRDRSLAGPGVTIGTVAWRRSHATRHAAVHRPWRPPRRCPDPSPLPTAEDDSGVLSRVHSHT